MSIHLLNDEHGQSASDLITEFAESLARPRQRRHELWILTCYVDLDLVEEYAGYLLRNIRLTNVFLAFNFSEIYKAGPSATVERLNKAETKLEKKGVAFEWKALASSKLVHSKSYALIQRSKDAVSGGFVLTTSANFTRPGFYGGNIEIGYLSTKKRDIRDFAKTYDYLWDALGRDLDSAIFKQEEYLLKFALLASGVFLHKWSGSLSQQIGIRYELTPHAKRMGAIAPELAAVGFEAGDTFTRQVLDVREFPAKQVPGKFIKRFTIETYWGRWCPMDAWDTLSESFEGAERFTEQFQSATEDSILEEARRGALEVQTDLVEKGLIKPVTEDHLDNWMERIQSLRASRQRLERFFTGYDAHALPYTIEQKADIAELFGSLMEAIALSRASNIAKEKMSTAFARRNPELLALSVEEVGIIHELLHRA